MKRLIATYALLMVLSMIVVSCEHKELCYSHPHSAKVSVEFEWSQMPAAYSPGGMRVIFYLRNGGEEIVRDFVGKKGGCVEIPSGVYDVVCFNNDTQRVKYNGADGFSSIAATTGVAQVGDVKAFRTPDYLCGGRMVAVKVEVKIGCEQIIVLPVAPMVCYYTYTVRGVKNLQSFSECVAIQRAMCSEYSVGGDNEIQESKADICFAMERNDDVITGWCYTFGAADCDVYKTILYIRTASGKMVKGEYDVTQQINSQKGHLKNLCGGRMVAVKVEVKIGCEQIIVLPVAPMVCYYTYTVRGVKNLQSFSECVAIQRAMCSEYSVGGDNEIQESKADICFAMERNDDVITGWCYTFGAADCDVYKTILYIRTASGKMVKGEYDVTQQINSQKGHLKNVDIVIDTDLDLDKHGGSSPGFDPSVDEWEDIESDIIL